MIDLESTLKYTSEELLREWLPYHLEFPDLVYQYRNSSGLIGILSSNRIWATNIQFVNDSSELLYACEVIDSKLKKFESTCTSNVEKQFIKQARATFNGFNEFFGLYITCFCSNGDLLSQWRGYGSGGGGYAIGLKPHLMESKKTVGTDPCINLRKVIYDRQIQDRLIDKTIETTIDVFKRILDENGESFATQHIDKFCLFLKASLCEFLFCFKSDNFVEEEEWRIFYMSDPISDLSILNFRPDNRGNLIPYVALEIHPKDSKNDKLPIEKIVHGPTLHPDLAKKSLELLLRRFKYEGVAIDGSTITLRF